MRCSLILTLFPYTTLFRSIRTHGAQAVRSRLQDSARPVRVGAEPASIRRASLSVQDAHPRREQARDRKSTRLNSSHLGISYAVFCLKKKKYVHQKGLPEDW